MYTLTDLCCLCLVNSNTVSSILYQDNDGIVVKKKLEYVFSEVKNFKSEVMNNICIDCLNGLNNVYTFKRECLQNLISLNNYIEKMSITLQECNYFDNSDEMDDQTTSANHITKIEIKQECTERDEIIQVKKSPSSLSQELKCAMSNAECTETYDKSQHSLRESQISDNNKEIEIVKQEIEYIDNEIYIKHEPLIFIGDDSEETNFTNELRNNSGDQNNRLKNQNVDITIITRPYKCDQCSKAFPTSSKLKRHNLSHTGERPFMCTTCQKSFGLFHHLKEHKRTHSNEKPYVCDVCHKTFRRKSTLVEHNRIHSNVRPYKCSVCQKKFTQSSSLKQHMRLHTGEKPFHCHVCEYKSIHKSMLKSHIIRMHKCEKPHSRISIVNSLLTI